MNKIYKRILGFFMNRKIELAMTISILFCAVIIARHSAILVQNYASDNNEPCIVIDAGHGGTDPGKIGINDSLEKDINLAIALKLRDLLEQADINVVLTRDSDIGLYSENASHKKAEDMQERCKIISDANPLFTISIHQNSYPKEYVHGAQVFYYSASAEGKTLAEILQTNLISHLDTENTRCAKGNDSYYLLKKTPTPTVIVECGFLSNSNEAELLTTDDYQNKVSRAIYLGILEYLKSLD